MHVVIALKLAFITKATSTYCGHCAVIYTPCPGKKDRLYFGYNFEKVKYIVVIFCKEYRDDNVKLLTQQMSTSPN